MLIARPLNLIPSHIAPGFILFLPAAYSGMFPWPFSG